MQNTPLRIALCDDEAADRQQLRVLLLQYLDEKSLYAELDEYASGEALLAGDPARYQLVFLDILMEGLSGMETAKALCQKNRQTQIVFSSTSQEFAAESYEVEAFYYLVKPLEREKLWWVLDKFFQYWSQTRMLSVKVGRTVEDVYLSDILFAEARGKKSILHMKWGDLEVSVSISELQNLLPPEEFVRPIRYALVAVGEIVHIPAQVLVLSDGTEIPVSRNAREAVRQAFAAYKWKKLRNTGGSP